MASARSVQGKSGTPFTFSVRKGQANAKRKPGASGPIIFPTMNFMNDLAFAENQAVDRLLRFLAVEGITGQEEAIGQEVVRALLETGVPKKHIHFDNAHKKIPLPTQTGNLIVDLPGTQPGPRRL